MTNHDGGSSLLQARTPQPHRHSHKVRRLRDQHAHFHEEVHRRAVAEHLAGVVTQVISVVQVVDTNGATLGVQTFSAPPVTRLIDPSTGLTANAAAPGVIPTPSLTVSGLDIPSPETSSSHEAKPLTSAPFLKPSGFHSPHSGFNATNTTTGFLFSNHTTLHSLFANTTRSSSSSTLLWNSSTSSSSPTRTSSTSRTPTAVLFTGDPDAGSPASTPHAEPSTSAVGGPPSEPKPGPPTSTVVGSVVGSVAGLALVFVAALFLLRWKRRHGNGLQLLDGDTSSGSRKALPAPSDARGAGGMSERGGISMGVPAALAALTGTAVAQQRRASQTPSESERGFYRVSGKKLPSVLQHGGDGYTDPRLSDMSGASYRDSVAMFGGPGTPRFAVGSPMRPDSGVPVLHPGPAVRTPVAEQGPFSDAFALTPPPPGDPIGRSQASQDGSRGSGSRFTEEI